LEENIDMDERCIPPDEVDHLAEGGDRYCLSFMLNGLETDFVPYSQQSITGFTETIKKTEEWTKEGLKDHIIQFVVEMDQVKDGLCVELWRLTGTAGSVNH
jgi:hypothetical protein